MHLEGWGLYALTSGKECVCKCAIAGASKQASECDCRRQLTVQKEVRWQRVSSL